MNNEEKILAMLAQMQKENNARFNKLEQGQAELKAEMNKRFDQLDYSLHKAWEDIAIVDKSIRRHEKEFHSA